MLFYQSFMIKKIDDINEFVGFENDDIYYVRIMSMLFAYGTAYDFAVFYKQVNDDGVITAIISRLDRDMTISYKNCDFDELIEFIEVIGYSSCLCDGIDGYSRAYDEGVIMSTAKKHEITLKNVFIDEFPKLMDIYNFNDFDSADFEAWYVDASYRIRHGSARAYSLNVDGEIASSAIFSSIFNDDAILTSVQTAPEYRNKGYGSALVSAMVCDIKGKVYLMRESDKNEAFYKKLCFENTGIWRMYK